MIDENFMMERLKEVEKIKRPILMGIYEQLSEELYRADEKYKNLIQVKELTLRRLELDEKQVKLLEEYTNCENDIVDLFTKRAFIIGAIIGNELKEELKIE